MGESFRLFRFSSLANLCLAVLGERNYGNLEVPAIYLHDSDTLYFSSKFQEESSGDGSW